MPITAPAQPDYQIGPSFAESVAFRKKDHHAPLGGRRYHFFERTSLMAFSQHAVGKHLLESTVFIIKLFQAFGVRDFHAAKFTAPNVVHSANVSSAL